MEKQEERLDILQDSNESGCIRLLRKQEFGKKYLADGKVRKIIFIQNKS